MSSFTASEVGCAATLLQNKHAPLTVANNEAALRSAGLETGNGTGPVAEAMRGRIPISLSDASRDVRWPAYQRLLLAAGCHGALSIPIQLEAGARCVLTYFATERHVFSPQAIRRGTQIADVASRSLTSALRVQAAVSTAKNLQAALEGRTSISAACGVIMAQNRCSYQDAFAILAKASSHRNVKVRQVAEGILEALPGGAPTTHFGK